MQFLYYAIECSSFTYLFTNLCWSGGCGGWSIPEMQITALDTGKWSSSNAKSFKHLNKKHSKN